MTTLLDPVTDNLLKSWERAGGPVAIAAKLVRAELDKEAEDEQRKTA